MEETISGAIRRNRQIESLMEAVAGLGLLIGANILWFSEDPGFISVSPHPFLFLTILIASRYGTFDGAMTGALCSLVYVAYLFAGRDLETVASTFELNDLIPAYLFMTMGVLLGEIRDMSTREVTLAAGARKHAEEELERLKTEHEALSQVKDELQQRILASADPLAEFYESARKLTTFKPEEAGQAIMDLTAKFTGAKKFALYMARAGDDEAPASFNLAYSMGWDSADEFATTLTADVPAVARAMASRDVVTLRDAGSHDAEILMTAPILHPDDMSVLGLIVVNRIPFVRLTQLTITHLATIAGWAGKALADARRFERVCSSQGRDEITEVFNFDFLSQRLREEVKRVERYGGMCSLLLVRVGEIDTLPIEDRRMLLKGLGSMLHKRLRTVDVVGMHRIPGVFAIVLPSTPETNAKLVSTRITDQFQKDFAGFGSRFAHLRLKMGVASTTEENQVTDARMFEAAERFDLTAVG